MDERQLSAPCPQCGEPGHRIEFVQDGLSIICPSLPEGALLWLMPDGKILRDNRRQFQKKAEAAEFAEFAEFTNDEDFFDAHTLIDA
jgi:hypothetical protein